MTRKPHRVEGLLIVEGRTVLELRPIGLTVPDAVRVALAVRPPGVRGPFRARVPSLVLGEDAEWKHRRDHEVRHVHQLTDLEIDGDAADGVRLLPRVAVPGDQ